jgi:hypothetical protein
MAKTWDEMTTEEHVASSARSAAVEAAHEAKRLYDETCDRWQRQCKADGVDPETERAYYEIDELKASLDAAMAIVGR